MKTFLLIETDNNGIEYTRTEPFKTLKKAKERLRELYSEFAAESDSPIRSLGSDSAYCEGRDGTIVNWQIREMIQ